MCNVKDLLILFFGVLGVRKYSVGSMYNAGQSTLYALSVWQALFLAVHVFSNTYQVCLEHEYILLC